MLRALDISIGVGGAKGVGGAEEVGGSIERARGGGGGGSLNEIDEVGPIRGRGRKRTPNVRLQDQ